MKRMVFASTVAFFIVMATMASAQDLGALARQQRAQKKPTATKVYTNDDIASQSVPVEPAPAADAKADAKADATADTKAKSKMPSADDKAKAQAALQEKVNAQKAQLASLTHDLDIADRENRLRVANYYADAGNSLRDPKKFQDEQRAKETELADKKKAIDDAKAKLDAMIEDGRKQGLKAE